MNFKDMSEIDRGLKIPGTPMLSFNPTLSRKPTDDFSHSIRGPVDNFSHKILGHAQDTFAVIHERFLKPIWGDNRVTAKLKHNQSTVIWEDDVYEVYIPTFDSPNYNLKYYRIIIKILPEISNKTKREEAIKLTKRIRQPLGEVESELICLVAYKQDKPGIVKGFKHSTQKGYFTGVFVSSQRSPDLIWKRILDHVHNFIMKKLDGLMRALGFETWVWKWLLKKRDNCFNMSSILKRFSLSIRQSVFTFVKLIQHLCDREKQVLEDIGVQNVAFSKTTREIKEDIAVLQKALKLKIQQEVNCDLIRVLGEIPLG